MITKSNYFFLDKPRTRYMFEPIEGCSFGCSYCNAYTNSSCNSWEEWVHPKINKIEPMAVVNEFNALNKKSPMKLDFVMVCSTSDPFQSVESQDVVFKSLTLLNTNLNMYTRTLSKGIIPAWVEYFPKNSVGITIDNIQRLHKNLMSGNLQTLKEITAKGIYTFVSLQPFDLNMSVEELEFILSQLYWVKQITFGLLDTEPIKHFERAFLFSDIIANFCLKNKINFLNGSPRFNKANKKRLNKIGVNKQIWFGDNIKE